MTTYSWPAASRDSESIAAGRFVEQVRAKLGLEGYPIDAQFLAALAELIAVSAVGGTMTIPGTDGINFAPGSDVDVDLLTIGVSGGPSISWDESEGQFKTNVAGWFINGITTMVSAYITSSLVLTPSTPASASATGTQGMIAADADYIYVCTATDTWKRVGISTWP